MTISISENLDFKAKSIFHNKKENIIIKLCADSNIILSCINQKLAGNGRNKFTEFKIKQAEKINKDI